MQLNQVGAAVIAGNAVTIQMARGGLCLNNNTCNYAAAPADVLNLEGTPAAAFSLFPMTLV